METRTQSYLFQSKSEEDQAIQDGFKKLVRHAVLIENDVVLKKICEIESPAVIFTFDENRLVDLKTSLSDTNECLFANYFLSARKIKISILISLDRMQAENINDKFDDIFIELTNFCGEKYLFSVSCEHAHCIIKFCYAAYTDFTETYSTPGKPALPLSDWDDLSIYKEHTHQYYKKIHDYIAQFALDMTSAVNNIYLIDIGTGLGDALDVAASLLIKNNKRVTALGIDISEFNINKARVRYADKNYRFEVGDSRKFATLLQEQTKHDYVLVISSGSLTRLVLNNTIEALSVLQEIYQAANAVIASGLTRLLITSRIAKKAGFHVGHDFLKQHSDKKAMENFLLLYKLSAPSHLPLKGNLLDLAWHADPVHLLREYAASDFLPVVEKLDISLANMNAPYLNSTDLFIYLPCLKKIYFTGRECWAKQMKAEALKKGIYPEIIAERHIEIYNNGNDELKRYTLGFYRHLDSLLFSAPSSKKNLEFLKNKSTQNKLYHHNFILGISSLDEILAYIKKMEDLATYYDDAKAMYMIAIIAGGGVTYCKSRKNRYVELGQYNDYKKSLFYCLRLQSMGYADFEKFIAMLELKTAGLMNNFDFLRAKHF